MKTVLLVGLTWMSVSAMALTPFELQWMNHESPGTLYKSSEHANPVLVIEAFFDNCPYCDDNAPNVDALAEEYANEPRVQVLDVGRDTVDSEYENWIAKHHPNHPVLKDAERFVLKQLAVTGYPTTAVVDCNGNVLYRTTSVWSASKKAQIRAAIAKGLALDCSVSK